jgi:hypothetical protein
VATPVDRPTSTSPIVPACCAAASRQSPSGGAAYVAVDRPTTGAESTKGMVLLPGGTFLNSPWFRYRVAACAASPGGKRSES